jgi:hypothetical protein
MVDTAAVSPAIEEAFMAGGTVIKGADGTVYFIRDELLEACRVEGEHAEHVDKLLNADGDEVQGFSFELSRVGPTSSGQLQPVAYVSGDLISGGQKLPNIGSVASTIMCPW